VEQIKETDERTENQLCPVSTKVVQLLCKHQERVRFPCGAPFHREIRRSSILLPGSKISSNDVEVRYRIMSKFEVTKRIPYNGYTLLYYGSFGSFMIQRKDGSVLPGMMSENGAKNHIDTVLNAV
jgi:hypothetical protein